MPMPSIKYRTASPCDPESMSHCKMYDFSGAATATTTVTAENAASSPFLSHKNLFRVKFFFIVFSS